MLGLGWMRVTEAIDGEGRRLSGPVAVRGKRAGAIRRRVKSVERLNLTLSGTGTRFRRTNSLFLTSLPHPSSPFFFPFLPFLFLVLSNDDQY